MSGVGCEERREVWTLEVTTFHKVCRNHCLKVGGEGGDCEDDDENDDGDDDDDYDGDDDIVSA